MGKTLSRLILIFMCATAASLHAEKNEFGFIGAGIETYSVSFDANTSLSSRNLTAVSLRMGKQTRNMRTVFTVDASNDLAAVGLFIDYIPLDTMFGTPKIRPYVGAHAQYLRYSGDNLDEEGFGLGGQIGLILYASDSIDIDLGYRYGFVQNSDILDTVDGFTVSLHYFFQ